MHVPNAIILCNEVVYLNILENWPHDQSSKVF